MFGLNEYSGAQIFPETKQNKSTQPKNKKYLFSLQIFGGIQSDFFSTKVGEGKCSTTIRLFHVCFMERDVLLKGICNLLSKLDFDSPLILFLWILKHFKIKQLFYVCTILSWFQLG